VKSIVTQIAEDFIKNLVKSLTEGKNFSEIEKEAYELAKKCASEVTGAYLEHLDRAIEADKTGRKQAGYSIERRGDERRLLTLFGEVEYCRNYYKKAAGGYEYLTDVAMGIESRMRVSGGMCLSLSEAAKDMSYAKAIRYVANEAVSRQTVMKNVRKSNVNKGETAELRHIPELHIDADEAHISLRGGKRSEVPLISVYEGIESKGKRNYCKEDMKCFDQSVRYLCGTWPERERIILENAGYLQHFVHGISICSKDSGANNGGCTEPHVSHILSARLSSRPMAWSKETLKKLAPVLAAGKIDFIGEEKVASLEQLPKPLHRAAVSANKAFRRGTVGLPLPEAIGKLPVSGKVTGTQKLLRLFV